MCVSGTASLPFSCVGGCAAASVWCCSCGKKAPEKGCLLQRRHAVCCRACCVQCVLRVREWVVCICSAFARAGHTCATRLGTCNTTDTVRSLGLVRTVPVRVRQLKPASGRRTVHNTGQAYKHPAGTRHQSHNSCRGQTQPAEVATHALSQVRPRPVSRSSNSRATTHQATDSRMHNHRHNRPCN